MTEKIQIVPSDDYATSRSTPSNFSAPSAPGVYDTLRASLIPESSTQQRDQKKQYQSSHPLESRLAQWESTQQNLRYALMRRTFGLTSTLGLEMQMLAIRSEDAVMPRVMDCAYRMHGGRSLHRDILMGNDCSLDYDDVFTGSEMEPMSDIHLEMDYRMGAGR